MLISLFAYKNVEGGHTDMTFTAIGAIGEIECIIISHGKSFYQEVV